MTIGQRIKQRRKELGLTQTELAHRLGNKSKVSVCTVENDKEDLTTDRIRKYAKALDCEPAYLMGWTGTPYQKQLNLYDLFDDEKEAENLRHEEFQNRFNMEVRKIAKNITTEEAIIVECYRNLNDSEKDMLKRMIAYYEKFQELKDKGVIK